MAIGRWQAITEHIHLIVLVVHLVLDMIVDLLIFAIHAVNPVLNSIAV